MKYIIDLPRFGKFFTVPCSAVENYIKVADGNYVKVLLCLLCSNSNTADVQTVAESCGISASQAEDGILFWQSRGVISAQPENSPDLPPTAVAASAPIQSAESVNPKSETEAKPSGAAEAAVTPKKYIAVQKTVVQYTPKEIAEKINQNPDLQTMFGEIERIFGKTLNQTQIGGFIHIYEYYEFDVPSIVMIVDFCKSMGKTSISYIESIARDWAAREICDFTQVEEEIIRQTEQNSYNSSAARVLGIEGKLTPKQQEFFAQWKEWGFDENMLNLAGELCRNEKNRFNLNYTNGILRNWHASGISTPEDVKRSKQAYEDSKSARAAESGEKTSYNINKWQSISSRLDPNKISFEEDDDN
jgi:DnaD/phage-associated family protein